MSNDPRSRPPGQRPARRGLFGNIRWWVLLAFAGYAAFYWFSNRAVDPYTGQKVLIDASLDAQQEKALGLQAYQQILAQERPLDLDAPVSREVRAIAQRLIAKVDVVETALAQEHGLQPGALFARLRLGSQRDPVRPGQRVLPARRQDGRLYRAGTGSAQPGRDGGGDGP
ncbi:MAG: hypothetical protein GAK31_01278 [Stenotrophomonas maltophilia]|uniref:Uncharacterized protein n=1 Tax=Stenotrophomonas maltophilia TaxID=40324 RepID=A0A7V8FHD1_STEMA|nr:MAG: hypothetical protein GAK31_01278 [Stenotrophomonas maltophilia]